MKYLISDRSVGVGNIDTKMNSSAVSFYHFLHKHYKNVTMTELVELDRMLSNYPFFSITERKESLSKILKPLKEQVKPVKEYSFLSMLGETNKENFILSITDNIDDILYLLHMQKENGYVFDPATSDTIPLKDKSVNIVLITRKLCHMHPEDKETLLREIKRVSTNNVKIIVQEYDNDFSTKLYYDIDLYNLYTSIVDKTNVNELHLTSKQELQNVFYDFGFTPSIVTKPDSYQQVYWTLFEHNTNSRDPIYIDSPYNSVLQYKLSNEYKVLEKIKMNVQTRMCFDDSLLRISFNLPQTPYHTRSITSSHVVKIGQLKLFIVHMQHILENWNPITTPKLHVVYAGAAPGHNFELLAKLFRGIEWHLYDPAEFMIKETKYIHIHTGEEHGYFTDAIAKKWSGRNDVIFFSDIRPRTYNNDNVKERDVIVRENMNQQANWVRIINPISASLKFRPPFSSDSEHGSVYNYLAGDITPQPFGPFGTEARLSPYKDYKGNYYNVDYDTVAYENIMFYFQAVTREDVLFSNPLVEATSSNRGCLDPLVECKEYHSINDSELDNHFDSVYYLRIIKMYSDFVTKYPRVGSVNTPLMSFAKSTLKRLFSLFSNTTSIALKRQRINRHIDL